VYFMSLLWSRVNSTLAMLHAEWTHREKQQHIYKSFSFLANNTILDNYSVTHCKYVEVSLYRVVGVIVCYVNFNSI